MESALLTLLIQWTLALMIAARPAAPWRDTFERTADAIAKAAVRRPLFTGAEGPAKTAALIVAVGEFESGLKPNAEGDCDKTTKEGTCVKGSRPHSFCLVQINESNFKALRTTREEVQTNIDTCVGRGLDMMHASFTVCRALPLEDRLRQYAAGGDGCPSTADAARKSKHRVDRAMWLFRTHPFEAVQVQEPVLAD